MLSNLIVGLSVSDRVIADLTVTALRIARNRRESDGVVIVHADQRSQFRGRAFQSVLKAAGHQGSMGRVAAGGDNVAIKSFRARLPDNVLNTGPSRTRAKLHYAITYWTEHAYYEGRRQRIFDRLTPIELGLAFTRNNT